MVFSHIGSPDSTRRPTEYLLGHDGGQLSAATIYKLSVSGFVLMDVQMMISLSDLYSTRSILQRILSSSIRESQYNEGSELSVRLDSQQSAVAFQFAKILEHAISVFGSLTSAEEWIGRSCKYLDGFVPLDVIDNPIGFQMVENYLERLELGVYQ
ncbi:MAG: antitoxin Xre/MbcA/ParS toxin-binding domain-containing protein [Pseudomonas sp.]